MIVLNDIMRKREQNTSDRHQVFSRNDWCQSIVFACEWIVISFFMSANTKWATRLMILTNFDQPPWEFYLRRDLFIAASSQAILKLLKIKELNPNSIHIHRTTYCISYHFWSNIQTCFCCRFLFPAMNAPEDHAFCFGEEVYYLSASNDWIPAVVEGHVMLNQKRHYNLNVQKAAEPNRVISKEQYQGMQHGHGQTPSQIFCFGEAVIWWKFFFEVFLKFCLFFLQWPSLMVWVNAVQSWLNTGCQNQATVTTGLLHVLT